MSARTSAARAGAGIVVRGGAAKGGPGKEQGSSWEVWQRVGIDDLLGGMSRQEFILRIGAGAVAHHALFLVQEFLEGKRVIPLKFRL